MVRLPLTEITGSDKKARILNQMLLWTSAYFTFDEWRKDGWVWKSGQKMAEGCLLDCSGQRAMDIAKELVEQGLMESRQNPAKKNCYEWRLNLDALYFRLEDGGYNLKSIFPDKNRFRI